MKVNNRKCITKMATRLLFANKRRNLITIFAIILTAVLFTSLFTIMLSINASYETGTFRQLGGYAHGTFKDVTEEQEERLIANKKIKAYGERIIIGTISDEPFRNKTAEISFMDDNTAKWSYVDLKEGHMPVEKNEVVMDAESIKLLGFEPVIGESIDLTFDLFGVPEEAGDYSASFILTGYWDYDTMCPAHFINVSKDFAIEISKIIEEMGYEPALTDLDVMLSSSLNVGSRMLSVIEECGYTYGENSDSEGIKMGVNPGYTMSGIDGSNLVETAVPLGVFLLLVIFTGYLIIYNVFQISVSNDIRFYGLLKTIGTTQRQVKRIIRLQALFLCLVGIPVGLILGYILGTVLTPAVLATSSFSQNSLTISTSPVIFIAAAFFELITVLMSISKPGRMAGKVSPIEALRFNEGAVCGKKKKATRGAKPWQMAFANTERNKKKTVLVFISLALSMVILNAVSLFVGGFDSEKWLDATTSSDFLVAKYPYFQFRGAWTDSITEEDIRYLQDNVEIQDGGVAYEATADVYSLMEVGDDEYDEYQEMHIGDIPYTLENGKPCKSGNIQGMDDYLLDKLTVYEGDVSLLNDKSGRYIALITHKDENGFYVNDVTRHKIGDKVTIAKATGVSFIDTRTGKTPTDVAYEQSEFLKGTYTGVSEYEYTVCAYVSVPQGISLRNEAFGFNAILSSDSLKQDFGESVVPVFYAFDTVSPDAEAEAESFINRFSEENSDISYESKAVLRAEFEDFKRMFTLLGGVLCLIIGFVGILNFFNTIMAGIIARKNEIAVLQAIGMTGKQVKGMLMTEGMIYTVGSGLLALILSLIFGPLVNSASSSFFWFYSSNFTLVPVLLMLPFMVLLGIFVPLLSYSGFSKASIVERIREIG